MKIAEIIENLKQPIPVNRFSQKNLKGNAIDYIAWYDLCDLLDERVGLGCWQWEIVNITHADNRIILTGKLIIFGDDRELSQCATGTEVLTCSNYGDPSSNAEAMSLRRACSKFGLARELWRKEIKSKTIDSYPKTNPKAYRVTELTNKSQNRSKGEIYAVNANSNEGYLPKGNKSKYLSKEEFYAKFRS